MALYGCPTSLSPWLTPDHQPTYLRVVGVPLVVASQGIPELVEGNAVLLGAALTEKGFTVTQPQASQVDFLAYRMLSIYIYTHAVLVRTHCFEKLSLLRIRYGLP